jgi:MFS family permease
MDEQKDVVDPEAPLSKFFESNAGDGTNVFEHYLTGLPFVMCFGSCFLTLFLIGLDQTIVAPLYSTMGNEFNDFNNIGWIMSRYMLSMCVLSATWGRLSILYGRKSSLLAAIALFEGGSLMCALAENMSVLIGGRVLVGVGAGGVQTLVFVVGTKLVPINQRPTIFVALSIAFSIASIVGPLIGGGFATNITWRWAFYLNLPIGGFASALLILFFHPPKPKLTWKEKLQGPDYLGTLLSTACFTLFLLALSFWWE